MPDTQTIALTDIRATLALGVTAAERGRPQEVLVSVALDIGNPATNDQLGDTIDYDMVIGFIREELPNRAPLHLIETVADLVATHVLALSARIETVVVTVKKPSVLPAPAMVAVTLTRRADPESRRLDIAIAEDAS